MSDKKINIITEIKPGIDPKTSNLVTNDLNEYWFHDQNSDVVLVGYHGSIAGNLWTVDGSNDITPTGAGTSNLWELSTGDTVLK